MWILNPSGSIGPLRIGMAEIDYITALQSKPELFRRSSNPDQNILDFDEDFVHLEILRYGTISKISVFRPREVSLSGVQILNNPLNTVGYELIKLGFNFVRVDAGLWNEANRILLVEVDGIVDGIELG